MLDDTGTEGQVGRHDDDRGRGAGRRPAVAVVNGPEDEITRLGRRSIGDRSRTTYGVCGSGSSRRRRQGTWQEVRNLQKLMLRSRANALLSVRRVTEVNAGRETAGVDGKVALLPQCEGRAGRLGAAPRRAVETQARQAGVHTEGQRATAPARHSRDRRQGAAGPDARRAGT